MAKFVQTVVKPSTAEEKKANIQTILDNFGEYKAPLKSTNPFSDGQIVEYDTIVPVSWKHEKYGDGQYLAIAFKGVENVLALSAINAEKSGFVSANPFDGETKTFANKGGLADVMSPTKWDKDEFNKLVKYLEKHKKFKVKLTYFYVALSANTRKQSTLTNIIPVEKE